MASILKVDKIVPVGSGGVSIAPASSTPTSPSAGQMYFNTTTNKLQIYNGTSWFKVDQSGTTIPTGGTEQIYEFNNTKYQSNTFLTSGTFTVISAITADILVIGGGGGGASRHGGGGGAGGRNGINAQAGGNGGSGIIVIRYKM